MWVAAHKLLANINQVVTKARAAQVLVIRSARAGNALLRDRATWQ